MFKRIVLIPAIVATLCVLVSSSVFAQSKEDGERLFQEGQELQQKARFKKDLEKAVEKYEQALKIFKAVKFDKGIGWVANQLGLVYADWGQYDKAEDSYEKALAIQRELKDRKGEGATLGNLGIV